MEILYQKQKRRNAAKQERILCKHAVLEANLEGISTNLDSVLATTTINLKVFQIFLFSSLDSCKHVIFLPIRASCKLAGNFRPLLLQMDAI